MPVGKPGKCVVQQVAVVAPLLNLAVRNRPRNQPSRTSVISVGKNPQGIRRANQASGLVKADSRIHSINGAVHRPAQFIVGVSDGVVWQRTVHASQLASAQSWD